MSEDPTAVASPAKSSVRLRNWVTQRCSPRGAMGLMLLATTAAGSIASFLLLHTGVSHFALRYGIAVIVAYGALLGCIGLWARYEQRRFERQAGASPGGGIGNVIGGSSSGNWSFGSSRGGGSSSGGGWSGSGGTSGGGGASASFAGGRAPVAVMAASESTGADASAGTGSSSSSGSSKGGGFSLDLDGDELIVIVLVVLAVAAAVIAAGYIIWIAPTFLGDVFVAGAAGAGISHRVAKADGDWLQVAFKKTILPAAGVFVTFVVAGVALHHYAPGARTLHEAWNYFAAAH